MAPPLPTGSGFLDMYNPDVNPLAPNYDNLPGGIWALAAMIAIVVLLLAAAVTRRLHDGDRSGAWGLLPLPFLAAIFALTQNRRPLPELWADSPLLVVGAVACGLAYLATFLLLAVLLGTKGSEGPNRFGAEPAATLPGTG